MSLWTTFLEIFMSLEIFSYEFLCPCKPGFGDFYVHVNHVVGLFLLHINLVLKILFPFSILEI